MLNSRNSTIPYWFANNCCSNPIFEESRTVDYDNEGSEKETDKNHRDSMSAYIPFERPFDGDVIVRCIEQRAARFQGYVPVENFEHLQVVRSSPGLMRANM